MAFQHKERSGAMNANRTIDTKTSPTRIPESLSKPLQQTNQWSEATETKTPTGKASKQNVPSYKPATAHKSAFATPSTASLKEGAAYGAKNAMCNRGPLAKVSSATLNRLSTPKNTSAVFSKTLRARASGSAKPSVSPLRRLASLSHTRLNNEGTVDSEGHEKVDSKTGGLENAKITSSTPSQYQKEAPSSVRTGHYNASLSKALNPPELRDFSSPRLTSDATFSTILQESEGQKAISEKTFIQKLEDRVRDSTIVIEELKKRNDELSTWNARKSEENDSLRHLIDELKHAKSEIQNVPGGLDNIFQKYEALYLENNQLERCIENMASQELQRSATLQTELQEVSNFLRDFKWLSTFVQKVSRAMGKEISTEGQSNDMKKLSSSNGALLEDLFNEFYKEYETLKEAYKTLEAKSSSSRRGSVKSETVSDGHVRSASQRNDNSNHREHEEIQAMRSQLKDLISQVTALTTGSKTIGFPERWIDNREQDSEEPHKNPAPLKTESASDTWTLGKDFDSKESAAGTENVQTTGFPERWSQSKIWNSEASA